MYLSVQTIVNGLFGAPKPRQPSWKEIEEEVVMPELRQFQKNRTAKIPVPKAEEFWGLEEFPEMKMTFNLADLEARNREAKVRIARRAHGLALAMEPRS